MMTLAATSPETAWRISYWCCQIVGWGIYCALGLFMTLPRTGPQPLVFWGYGLFFVYSLGLTHALRGCIRRRGWLSLPAGPAVVRLMAAALAVAAVQCALVVLVQAFGSGTSEFEVRPAFLGSLVTSTVVATGLWTALYTGAASLRRGWRIRQDALALELKMREARLQALESQIGPHFLFNCLNSLRGMILENPVEARQMVTRLANILRHNLARPTAPTESLEAQIAFTRDYLALETIRFEERLRTSFRIDPDTCRCAVPAMLLQTLVENAIKHGISHLPAGGEVSITSRRLSDAIEIRVENTGRLVPSPAGSTRVGLANLRERLRALYGDRADFDLAATATGSVVARVRVPVE